MDSADIIMLLDNPLASDQRVEKEAQSLASSGFEVLILATNENSDLPTNEKRNGYIIERSLDVELKHPLRKGYKKRLEKAVNLLLSKHCRILHCHDYFLLQLAAQVKEKRPELYLTYDAHEYLKGWPYYKEIEHPLNRFKGRLVWQQLKQLEARNIHQCNLLITPSEALRKAMIIDHRFQGDSLAIRNIPSKMAAGKRRDVRSEAGIDSDKSILVHSGSVYMSDAFLDTFVALLEEQKNFALLFIGNRPRHFELQKEFAQHPQVHFMDYDVDYLIQDLAQCDAGIAYTRAHSYIAHRLGSSNRVMEYSMAGIPIIATEQITHRELQEAFGHVLLFNESDEATLNSALKEFRKERETLKANALASKDKLSWEQEISPLEAHYKALLH